MRFRNTSPRNLKYVDSRLGIYIVALGVIVVLVGLAAMAGLLGWVGRLPGDLRYGNGNVRVFAPFATMILLSVVLTIVLNLFVRR